MPTFVRPDGDQSTGNWTSTPLWQKIDEVTPSDTDFVQSENDPSNDTMEVTLENQTDPASSSGHIVRYRYQKGQSGGGAPGIIDITFSLYQGTTLIAETTHNGVATGFVAGSFTLSGAEADNITDYNDLRVRVLANKSSGTRTSWGEVSWAEFETPSGAVVSLAGSGPSHQMGLEPLLETVCLWWGLDLTLLMVMLLLAKLFPLWVLVLLLRMVVVQSIFAGD
ncbi:hypothetical protein LCGC14_1074170 [marine sediment metagenome]|uniref:Uncharacterized protein n=1 Tax=marine sediment metagenome TaxID=412755 RepID=A0A0F9QN34_9ZZZZ